jgi:hypothetical protein
VNRWHKIGDHNGARKDPILLDRGNGDVDAVLNS